MSNGAHTFKADFGDWLNPMIVKELRQGLRTHGFVWRFLIVQVAMVFIVAMSVAAQDNTGARGVITFFFWFIVAIPLVFIIPNIGTGAVADERLDHTLEPILLTRLSPWQILFGKWLALVAQSVLLVVTVLPYLVIRYYVGGINLLQELATLGNLLLASAVLTAAAIGLSPYLSRVGRIVITFLAVFGALFLWNVVTILLMTSARGGGSSTFGGWDWVFLALIAAVFVVLFFEIGASRIAPVVSLHSLRMRMVGLISALTAGAWAWVTDFGDEAFLAVALPALLAATIAMLETVPLFRPPRKNGKVLSVLKDLFFSRGWPSGVAYAVLLTALLAGVFFAIGGFAAMDTRTLVVVSAFATLFFIPAVLLLPLVRKAKSGFAYVGVFVLCFGLGLFLFVLKNASGSDNDFMFALSFLPPAGLIFAADVDTGDISNHTAVTAAVGAAAMLVLWLRAVMHSIKSRKSDAI